MPPPQDEAAAADSSREASPSPQGPRRHRFSAATRANFSFSWRFLALLALFSTISYVDETVFDGAGMRPITVGSATVVAASMNLFGADVTHNGSKLHYRSRSFDIIPECTSIEVLGMFTAAVLAFPAAWATQWRGLAIGLSILMAINQLRIVTLVVIGAHSDRALDIGHIYVWPVIVVGITIGIWLSWIRTVTDVPGPVANH